MKIQKPYDLVLIAVALMWTVALLGCSSMGGQSSTPPPNPVGQQPAPNALRRRADLGVPPAVQRLHRSPDQLGGLGDDQVLDVLACRRMCGRNHRVSLQANLGR